MISVNSAVALPSFEILRSSSFDAEWVLARIRKIKARMDRSISLRNSASCSANREVRVDLIRLKHDCERGVFWWVWNVRRSNAAMRIVEEVLVSKEEKNVEGRPMSAKARIARISCFRERGSTIIWEEFFSTSNVETEH